MTDQIVTLSHPERNCLGQVPTVHFRLLATWLLKFPVASQPPPDVRGSSRDMAPPTSLKRKGACPCYGSTAALMSKMKRADPLWFRFLSNSKRFFCKCYSKGNVWRGLLSATQKGRSGNPGGKSNLCSEIGCFQANTIFLLSFLRAIELP